MISTLADVATGALTAIGQLGEGQSMSAEDSARLLRLANLLLSKASTRRLYLYVVNNRVYTLPANAQSIQIGPAAGAIQANDTRPTFIESAQITVPYSGVQLTVRVIQKPDWDNLRNKQAVADIPDVIYPAASFPNMTIFVNPATRVPAQLQLGCWEQLTQFNTILDPINFPPAYEEWLESTLAVMAAPFYDMPVPQALALRMADADAAVREYNAQSVPGAVANPSGSAAGAPASAS